MYTIENLYLENHSKEELISVLDALTDNFTDTRYYGILHDKDIKTNGELKKPHFHLIVDFSDNTHHTRDNLLSFFRKALNDSKIRIDSVRNVKACLRYLTHIDNVDKHLYNEDEIFSNDMEQYTEITKAIAPRKEMDTMLELFCEEIEKGNILCREDAYLFFRSKGKLTYFVQHARQLLDLIALQVNIDNPQEQKR